MITSTSFQSHPWGMNLPECHERRIILGLAKTTNGLGTQFSSPPHLVHGWKHIICIRSPTHGVWLQHAFFCLSSSIFQPLFFHPTASWFCRAPVCLSLACCFSPIGPIVIFKAPILLRMIAPGSHLQLSLFCICESLVLPRDLWLYYHNLLAPDHTWFLIRGIIHHHSSSITFQQHS